MEIARRFRRQVGLMVVAAFIMISWLAAACVKSRQAVPSESVGPGLLPTPTETNLANSQSSFYQGTMPLGALRFERLLINAGLSQSVVFCIYQDSIGFMWFGTQDGLNKYDGYTFTVYNSDPNNPYSLSDRWITTIFEDHKGGMWIGTRQGGLNFYDRKVGRFTNYQFDPANPYSLSSNSVTGITEDNLGRIWVGTVNGLNMLEPDTGVIIRFQYDPDTPNSLIDNRVSTMLRDQEGMIWVGTANGLDRFDPLTNQFVHYQNNPKDPYSLSTNIVKTLYEDQGGILWVGTANGLNWFSRNAGQFIVYRYRPNDPVSLTNNNILSIHEDHTGMLWVGTDHGLNRLDRETGVFTRYFYDPNDSSTLSSNTIQSVYEDRSGVLWVGTYGGGLNRSSQGKWGFAHIQAKPQDADGLSGHNVSPIFEDNAGNIWIGTYEGGLDRYNRRSGRFVQFQNDPADPASLSSDHVWAIYQDRDGQLWIGTSNGLDLFDTKDIKFIHYRYSPSDSSSLSNNLVYAIYEDSQGTFWVGTANGLNRFDRESGKSLRYFACTSDPGCLSDNYVTSIYEDRQGRLWIGTFNGGLNLLDRASGKFQHFMNEPHNSQSLSNNSVMAIYQDSRGLLWVATAGGGINQFNPETNGFIQYRQTEGLPNDVVYGILEDDNGDLWLSTNKGIARLNPLTGAIRNYDVTDGLQSNEFSRFSYLKTRSGEMYFGGVNGITLFYPEQIQDNTYVPPMVLTALTQAGENITGRASLETINEITLYWPRNFFEFEFAALSYVQPEKNQYAYKLENFDTDWVEMGSRRFGRYTNLPGGTYILRIKGSNNDGVWNETGIAIRVKVVPPIWETTWFRLGVVLVVLVMVVGGFRLRVKNIEARNRELEYQVSKRTREIERRNQELDALSLANERMHRYLALDQVLQTLVDVSVDMLKADKSAVFVWDESDRSLAMRVARGFNTGTAEGLVGIPEAHIPDGGTPVPAQAIVNNTSLVAPDSGEIPAEILQVFQCEGIHSFMQLPIEINGEYFGIFTVCSLRDNAFGEDEQRLFTTLIQRAVLSIENAQLFEKTKELVVMEERSRLARDLHDSAKQKAFAALAQLGAATGTIQHNPVDAQRNLAEAENLVYEVIQELTFLIQELYPLALKEKGLVTALREYIFDWENRTDIVVDLKFEGAQRLPLDVEQALYRIVQESLANVARHSQASQVSIRVCYATNQVAVDIIDNGQGFDREQKPLGVGLHSMQERAEKIGGSLSVESQVGQGTHVKVIMPSQAMPGNTTSVE